LGVRVLAGVFNELCVQIGADRGDREIALGVLLGAPR
jgi:hypothetical protein